MVKVLLSFSPARNNTTDISPLTRLSTTNQQRKEPLEGSHESSFSTSSNQAKNRTTSSPDNPSFAWKLYSISTKDDYMEIISEKVLDGSEMEWIHESIKYDAASIERMLGKTTKCGHLAQTQVK